ncbi:MAG: DUF4159 domain-containing protein [Kiritimatiellaeota bacterium]|nr:DUF4159 domain-containing protein [Kiritimatiellota bacterium]
MPLEYGKKLDQLEAIVEAKMSGRFRGLWALVLAIMRSRYFLISLCFYFILLLILSGIVVSHYVVARGTFEEGAVLVLPPGGATPPPAGERGGKPQATKQTREVAASVPTMSSKAAANTAAKRLTISAPSSFMRVDVPVVAPQIQISEVKTDTQMAKNIADANIKRLIGVREFQKGWGVSMGGSGGSGGGSGGGRGSGGGGSGMGGSGNYRGIRAKFTIFQAKYQDGDWNCNPAALQNLMLQIRAWSRDRIDAQLVPEVLDIGTDKLFTLKPPFVYLTGHKDFHFMDNEVKNLRDYLSLGGAIWGDSALAGRRSRFDIAFRREMKRVLPDREFEIVPENHEMFDTFFENIGLPSGMNNYREPVEMINIGGKLAVLYSLNGYGHFWEARLDRDGKIEWNRVNMAAKGEPLDFHWVFGPHLYPPLSESGLIYRNISDETTRNIYKFGINVVVHLLTRYQRDFMLLPKELPTGPSKNQPSRSADDGATVTNAPAKGEDDKGSKAIDKDKGIVKIVGEDEDKDKDKKTKGKTKSTKSKKDK